MGHSVVRRRCPRPSPSIQYRAPASSAMSSAQQGPSDDMMLEVLYDSEQRHGLRRYRSPSCHCPACTTSDPSFHTGAKAGAWCLLTLADASLSRPRRLDATIDPATVQPPPPPMFPSSNLHGGQGESLAGASSYTRQRLSLSTFLPLKSFRPWSR